VGRSEVHGLHEFGEHRRRVVAELCQQKCHTVTAITWN
jgi:hypothetical protein